MLGIASVSPTLAQRNTDVLDRGLVAVKTSSGVLCTWRIPAEEYYDVKYNIYRDGTKLNATPLSVSNYTDKNGTLNSSYTVEAVVRGQKQAQSKAVTPWAKNYLEVKMDHGTLKSTYVPNDACCADVDGDGEVEILLKFDNRSDAENGYKPAGYNGEYAIIEVYKLNGKKLWWIDLGPNMADFQNNENNIVAFDWDRDGKAEAVLRAADGTVIHMADGTTKVIGDKTQNYRNPNGSSGQWFIHEGSEFLLYLNGETGEPYQIMDYPLKRLEAGETDLSKAWGDGYGHRSTKHFFGAPFLDGKKASIFLARGIYTRHKMIALDVDPATHQLKERWRWNCNTPGSPWYGQGYHNFGIADVDMDGRDEIVYGSMVIDDNGKGLSTTGLGHGDSQHCGDFDPYTWGEEIFACNEDRPQNNFRDATTSKIYYRSTGSRDDGRAIAGNFLDEYPGAQCRSAADPNIIGGASHKAINGSPTDGIATNFRIYWDGDLLDETFNYVNGKNTEGAIYKGGRKSAMATLEGSMTNNDTKGTPCYQGDILGDWREEVIMRTADNNIRIYTTNYETPWRNYSLWHDHQYRNAMVWQMCGYNQTPHVSYFLGMKEGITVAPPPLTNAGRTAVGSIIGADAKDKHILLDTQADTEVAVSDGAAPYIFTDNAPSWTQGHDDNNNITTTTYTHKLTGGAFTGSMRLVKQGEGVLELPNVVETYTGSTDVWNGTLRFDGTLQQSRLWLNRHTTLQTTGGKFLKGIQADYNATIKIGGAEAASTLETDSLLLGFGSRLQLDLFSEGMAADQVKASVLKIEKKDWSNGPRYNTPVVQVVKHVAAGEEKLAPGKYLIGEVGKVEGDISDLVIEGLNAQKSALSYEDGKLYITVSDFVVSDVTWNGTDESADWNTGDAINFKDDKSGEASAFVPGDGVTFDDTAENTNVVVTENVAPKTITFNNSEKSYVLSGDSIVGGGTLTKNGTGIALITNDNHIGNTTINGGTLAVRTLANSVGHDYGALGGVKQTITINNNAALGIRADVTANQPIVIGTGGATIDVETGTTLTMSRGISAANAKDAVLTKSGYGTLTLGADNKMSKLLVKAGSVNTVEGSGVVQLPATVEFVSGTVTDPSGENSYASNNANFVVPELCKGTLVAKPRCEYKGSLTGTGTFTVYATGVRCYFAGDWSQFEGTIIPALRKRGTYDPSFEFTSTKGLGKATLQMDEGVEFKNNGHNVELGAVTGKGTLSGTGSYILGANNSDFTYSTPCSSPIIKRGSGMMDIRALGILTGSITVEEGTLANTMATYKTKLNGTSSITLKGTSKFRGATYVNSCLMNDNSSLELMRTTSTAGPVTFKTDGMFYASANTMVTFKIASVKSASKLEIGTALTLGGITVVLADDYTPASGDSFTLWTSSRLTAAPTAITLPTLPDGLYWDTTGLSQAEGVLRVTNDPTAINDITVSKAADYEVYTVGGVRLGTVQTTKANLRKAVRRLAGAAGTYIVRSANGEQKLMVK